MGRRNHWTDACLLAASAIAIHFLMYQACLRLFRESLHYSGSARVLVIGNSRIEQGILRHEASRAAPGRIDFLASQGMDMEIATRLLQMHLDEQPGTGVVWLGVDPWALSGQYSEEGYRNWLPWANKPALDGYFRVAMRDEPREYWFMKILPVLRFNRVKTRLLRTALGMGSINRNRAVVSSEAIREVVDGYEGRPLRVDPSKLRRLSEACSLSASRGIAMRLFFMPVIPELARPWDIPGFRATMDSLAASHPGTRFLDFSEVLPDHGYFRDTGHLNRRGAEAFTRIFLDSLDRH